MNELSQLASVDLGSAWFGPVVEQLSGIQTQLTSLLATEGNADSSYQTDLAALVSNEKVLTTLLSEIAPGGSSQTNS